MEAMIQKASTMKTGQLKEAYILLQSDFRDGVEMVMESISAALETRLSEDELVAFYNHVYENH